MLNASPRKASGALSNEHSALLKPPKIYTVDETTHEITGRLKDPVNVIRQLAEEGTEVTLKDATTGKLQRKWLAVRSNIDAAHTRTGIGLHAPRQRTSSNESRTSQSRRSKRSNMQKGEHQENWYLKSKVRSKRYFQP